MNASDTTSQNGEAWADDGDGSSPDADNPPERSAPPPAEIEVRRAEGDLSGPSIDMTWLGDRLREAVGHVGRPVAQIAVTIVGDDKMRGLNDTHRGVADTTDVLAFDRGEAGGPIEADIVICVDEAARRITELGHRIEQELLLYALHGVLHCAGFDDHTNEDFEAMHAEEDRILSAIGVGPTFDRDSSGHDDRRTSGLVTGDHAVD
jgi:probable rRNA maturation factor